MLTNQNDKCHSGFSIFGLNLTRLTLTVKPSAGIEIVKASGDVVIYSKEKLHQSLVRAGASEHAIQKVMEEMDAFVRPGMTTRHIFRHAFKTLKKVSTASAARYKLKQAIMELGPSGFAFELFVAALLKSEGYRVESNAMVAGRCVNHEVDVIASKQDEQIMVECKFHNRQGIKCDVKVPLYIHSRFEDVSKADNQYRFTAGRVFTNTRFTDDAIRYGTCVGMQLTGWDYPKNQSLRELVDRTGLHPITCLSSLTGTEKSLLMEKKVVHTRALLDSEFLLTQMRVSKQRQKKIIDEAEGILVTQGIYSI